MANTELLLVERKAGEGAEALTGGDHIDHNYHRAGAFHRVTCVMDGGAIGSGI